jgi:hypothetical protein
VDCFKAAKEESELARCFELEARPLFIYPNISAWPRPASMVESKAPNPAEICRALARLDQQYKGARPKRICPAGWTRGGAAENGIENRYNACTGAYIP